jgi:hypothetical protein
LVESEPPGTPDGVAVQRAQSTNGTLADEPPPPAPAAPATKSGRSQKVQQTAGAAALKLADRVEGVTKIVDRIGSKDQPGRFGRLANNSSIVLLPVALVVMVLIMWLSGTGESEFETCVTDAKSAAVLARGIASSDVQGLLAAWNAALLTTERCGELRPDVAPDPEIQAIEREGRGIIDQLNYIERRETQPIEAFPNASLGSLVLRGDDLYVLDDGNQQVYRVTLAEDGLSMVPNTRQPVATMRRGAAVGAFTVSRVIDITWAEDGAGLSQGNVLIALDEEGVLIEYSPTFLARGVQRLLGSDQWVNPVKMQMWRGRIYLLDPGADQIWRYDPTGGAFPGTPLEYFVGARRPSLEGAVDFAIDDSGRVYVLFADGIIAVFRSSEEVAFGWASFPPNMELESPNNMFLDTNPLAQTIYINDRANRTIFVTSMAGTFNTSYRAFDESFFDLLSDIAVDENRRIIYVTSGNSILALPR